MTKADIINEVAIATGMPKKEVGTVVEAFMEEVKKCLIEERSLVQENYLSCSGIHSSRLESQTRTG